MLLKFTLSNYRSFKGTSTLDLEARAIKEYTGNVSVSQSGTQSIGVLKSIALLGANASGKSNLFRAFDVMRYMVINSAKETAFTKTYSIESFKLSTETEHQPSSFECTMIINDVTYRYGFTCNNRRIISEWLYLRKKRREETVFIRTKNEYEIIKHFPTNFKNKLQMLTELTRKDTLYISVLAQFNIHMGVEVSDWFTKNIIYSDPGTEDAINSAAELLVNPIYNTMLNEIIKKCDLGFIDIKKQRAKPLNGKLSIWEDLLSKMTLKTSHIKYDAGNRAVEEVFFELNKEESSGARKLVAILGPIVKVLIEGGVFWIDDLDAKIHPYIIEIVMDLFNSGRYNKKGAQLVAISYNQETLKKLRRDQIVFLDKDIYGASSICALSHYKSQVSKNTFFDKMHLEGQRREIRNKEDSLRLNPEQLKEEFESELLRNGCSQYH